MRRVYSPDSNFDGPANCADALEPAFMQLLDRAEQAGWERSSILGALCVLTWRLADPELMVSSTSSQEPQFRRVPHG